MDRRNAVKTVIAGGSAFATGAMLAGNSHAQEESPEVKVEDRITFDEALKLGGATDEQISELQRSMTEADNRFVTMRLGLGRRGGGRFEVDVDGIPEGFHGVAGWLTEFGGHVGSAVIETVSLQIHPARRYIRIVGSTGRYAQVVSLPCILFRV